MNDDDDGQQWNCCQMNQMNPKCRSLNQRTNDDEVRVNSDKVRLNSDKVRLKDEQAKLNDDDDGQQWNHCQMNQMNEKSPMKKSPMNPKSSSLNQSPMKNKL